MAARARDRTELAFLLGGLLLVVLLLGFAVVADLVLVGETQGFDDRVLRVLRRADDPALPIGPVWLRLAALDITALGSGAVLGLVVFAIAGFMVLQGLRRTALFVCVASIGGLLLNSGLKEIFQRARPAVVPHLREVMTLSFPSGHAMTSAVVYLTLGALLMRVVPRRATKIYCMAVAILIAALVGLSRIYLGVHHTTDVIAGFAAALIWILVVRFVELTLRRRRKRKEESI